MATRVRTGGEERLRPRPRAPKEVACAVPLQVFVRLPVTQRGEYVRMLQVLPELEAGAAGKGLDVGAGFIKDAEKIARAVGLEGHANESNQHGIGTLLVEGCTEKIARASGARKRGCRLAAAVEKALPDVAREAPGFRTSGPKELMQALRLEC